MLRKPILLCMMIATLWPLTVFAGGEHGSRQQREAHHVPNKKRTHLDTKGAVRGSGFRVSWIHPMRGNFAEYDKLEIVNLTSAIGDHVSTKEMEKYTEDLFASFKKVGIFKEVRRVDELKLLAPPAPGERTRSRPSETEERVGLSPSPQAPFDREQTLLSHDFQSPSQRVLPEAPARSALEAPLQVIPSEAPLPQTESRAPARSPLEAPLAVVDAASLPEEEAVPLTQTPERKRTMVITGKVIYFKKGNRGLRALGVGLGYHRFVVRFHIYDKELGQELSMGNMSGEVSSGFLSIPGLASNADGRKQVVEALVNRVELRRAKSYQ